MIQLRDLLYQIKESFGLETITLIHRSAGPIESVGHWKTKNTIYGFCSMVLNIADFTMELYLKEITQYFIDLGVKKMVIIPFSDAEYFLLITFTSTICNSPFLKKIEDTFLPTLNKSVSETTNPLANSKILTQFTQYFTNTLKDIGNLSFPLEAPSLPDFVTSSPLSGPELKQLIFDYLETIPDVKTVSIMLNMNTSLYWIVLDPAFATLQKLSPSLFNKIQQSIAQIFPYKIISIYFKFANYYHLIQRLNGGLFCNILAENGRAIPQIQYYVNKADFYVKSLAE